MAKQKLHSGMSVEQIQSYCDERSRPTKEGEVIESCSPHIETLMLIANLAASIKDKKSS